MDTLSRLKTLAGLGNTQINESNTYTCVHVKKGKCEVEADSSYGAAKKAAEKWGLKSTSGIDAHLHTKEQSEHREMKQQTATESSDETGEVLDEGTNMRRQFHEVVIDAMSQVEDAGAYGDPSDEDVASAYRAFESGDFETAAELILRSYTDQDGGEIGAIGGIYSDLVDDLEYIANEEVGLDEAAGVFAEAYFDLIDRVGGDASLVNNEALAWLGTDAKHEITGNDDDYEDYMSANDVAGEITRYMSGDDIRDFVDHFERHYDLGDELEEESATLEIDTTMKKSQQYGSERVTGISENEMIRIRKLAGLPDRQPSGAVDESAESIDKDEMDNNEISIVSSALRQATDYYGISKQEAALRLMGEIKEKTFDWEGAAGEYGIEPGEYSKQAVFDHLKAISRGSQAFNEDSKSDPVIPISQWQKENGKKVEPYRNKEGQEFKWIDVESGEVFMDKPEPTGNGHRKLSYRDFTRPKRSKGSSFAAISDFGDVAAGGGDPIDLLMSKHGMSMEEIDALAQEQGFSDAYEWAESYSEISEAKAKKIACKECDAVSTEAKWKKRGGSCPNCGKSTQGFAVEGKAVKEGRMSDWEECPNSPDGKHKYSYGECEHCGKYADDHSYEESTDSKLQEAPTMDTTQLTIMMRNAGLSEEKIQQKLREWANTPEGVGEVEPTNHGEPYEAFAQSVNLSLKKYLDAQDMAVTIKEHTSKDLTESYKAYKSKK